MKSKNYAEVSWEQFTKRYSFQRDHVHITAVILRNDRRDGKPPILGIDPIILVENTEDPRRVSRKFPGAGFEDKTIIDTLIKTGLIKNQLVELGFEEYQYKKLLGLFDQYDIELSLKNTIDKEDYLFLMRKAVIFSVLQKTGYLIEVEDMPFFIDQGKNEEDPESNSFRIFFRSVKCKMGESSKQNKTFYLLQRGLRVLYPKEYYEIAKYQDKIDKDIAFGSKNKTVLKEHLFKALSGGYRRPLVKFLQPTL